MNADEEWGGSFVPTAAALAIWEDLRSRVLAHTGGLHIISGPEQSGRSTLLQELSAKVKRLPDTTVIGISRKDTGPAPSGRGSHTRPLPIAKILKVFGQATSVAAVSDPLVRGIVATSLSLWDLLEALLDAGSSQFSDNLTLESALDDERHAKGTLLLVLDDVDKTPDSGLINSLLLSRAQDLFGSLRIHVIVTIQGSPTLRPTQSESEGLRQVAAILRDRQLAFWYGLPPPDPPLLQDLFGSATPEVYRELLKLTEARLDSMKELWEDWIRSGILIRHPAVSRWQFTGGALPVLGSRTRAIIDDKIATTASTPVGLDLNRRILATAALEGKCFTAEAVASVLELEEDMLMDLLDEQLQPSGSEAIVRFAGWVRVGEPGSHELACRYEFESDLVWLHSRRAYFTRDEERATAEEMFNVLQRLFRYDLRPILRSLAGLSRALGDEEGFEALNKRADYEVHSDVVERLVATSILHSNALGPNQRNEGLRLLAFLVWHFNHDGHSFSEGLRGALLDTVIKLARMFDARETLLWGLHLMAHALLPMNIPEAEKLVNEGLILSKDWPYWHRRMRIEQANVWVTRQSYEGSSTDVPDPWETLEEVGLEARGAGDIEGELRALSVLTKDVILDEDGLPSDKSMRWLRRYRTLAQVLGITDAILIGLHHLSRAEAARGNTSEALSLGKEALDRSRINGYVDGATFSLGQLANIYLASGDKTTCIDCLSECVGELARHGTVGEYLEVAGTLDLLMLRPLEEGMMAESLEELNVGAEAGAKILESFAGMTAAGLVGMDFATLHNSRLHRQQFIDRVMQELPRTRDSLDR